MNRLILLGNGFDLAHKMRTSYYDFISSYVTECFWKAAINRQYSDQLISISATSESWYLLNPAFPGFDELLPFSEVDKVEGYSMQARPFTIRIENPFIARLFIQCRKCRWVDIENEYYKELKHILQSKSESESERQEQINLLNTNFEYLKKTLEDYLSTTKSEIKNNNLKKLFWETIKKTDVVTHNLPADKVPANFMVLNFNYTNTVEQYIEPEEPFDINYIHGKIKDNENPIIFGFGDELDDNYSKIELDTVKGFMENIKSFGYFRTSNYHNLIRFIDSDRYQVSIFGHSCGLSDRTMLNMIFEHKNCTSIKIFYYKKNETENNYKELTQEISRHFRNKGDMRKIIVPFDKSTPMPQVG